MMHNSFLAYVGPETVLPLTSVLAAVGGVVLLMWGRLKRACSRLRCGWNRCGDGQ
jgi:hypothetical protein